MVGQVQAAGMTHAETEPDCYNSVEVHVAVPTAVVAGIVAVPDGKCSDIADGELVRRAVRVECSDRKCRLVHEVVRYR